MVINSKYDLVSFNLDDWGKSEDTNILYITGLSGSGKSTLAREIADSNDEIISLDFYTEWQLAKYRNKEFNKYLNRNCPHWIDIPNADNKFRFSDEYWKLVDNFRNCLIEFSREQYIKGNRVIVEGIQIADEWFVYDYDFYKNKPVIVLLTSIEQSMKQMCDRDGCDLDIVKQSRKTTYNAMQDRLDDFIKELEKMN